MGKNKNTETNIENVLEQNTQEGGTTDVQENITPDAKKQGDTVAVDVIFERYANIDRYYTTADKKSFFSKNDAHHHAQTLKDTTIKEINR